MAVSYETVCVLALVALSCLVYQTTAEVPEIECNAELYAQAVALEQAAPQVAKDKILACQMKTLPSLAASHRTCPEGRTYEVSALLTGVLKEPIESATCALETLKELKKPGVLPAADLATLVAVELEATDLFLKVFGHLME